MEDILQYILGFGALGLLWTITDPERPHKKSIIDTLVRRDKTNTALILVGVMLMQLVGAIFIPIFSYSEPLAIGASALFWFGFFLAVWAKLTMKSYWGTPATHNAKRQTRLLTQGPFRYTRNPIYVGLILMSIGAGVGIRSIFAPMVILFILHVRRIVVAEEVLLTKVFGQKYREYIKTVPRFI